MRILLTGAQGQVGSALQRVGKEVPGIDLVALGSKQLDITDRDAVRDAVQQIKPSVLVNAAAYTAVDRAEQETGLARRVNTEGPGWLADAAAELQAPLIHFSTDYVFDGSSPTAYREEDPVAPLGVYGSTKWEGEEAIRQRLREHLIFRTSWVFGLEGNNFPKVMLRLGAERSELGVVDDQYGCPTFADDIAIMVFAVLGRYQEHGSLDWGTYHYAGNRACTWFEFATHILGEANARGLLQRHPQMRRLTTSEYPTAARRPANSRLDCQKFQKNFPGISLSHWESGVARLIDSLRPGRPVNGG